MYKVLTPTYTRYGDYWGLSWQQIGVAKSMADAKSKYGGSPVLEKM